MFRAKAFMKTNVVSVKRQTDIYDAIQTMVDHNVTGLPVVNEDMTLAGIISEKDVLKLLYSTGDKPGNVEDFMTDDPVLFDEEESVVDICDCLIKNNFRRVPILSNGKLVGIISRKDIIAYILKLRQRGRAASQAE